ncbi:MAG: translation elongation factor Ts [Ilumatobacteraceae bacterium]|jgi:elongation factor Ts|nr:translation elongation factor Ts [Actinomycetota bacterium]NCZ55728.1 translation elongation factor Ts [Acidimicrobiia bacterium]NCV47047.1 translation elongation factor Ts [Actinomycetota bacterium]NDC11368.1 translation elongation factor Ts [Actinomycetota bacterium]NDD61628.1 translation elongation factor Ts [Actinomycetota bacterium]
MAINAKDVQALRQATGAGMMDCKKALEESAGDVEAAKKWLREKGLSATAKRADRENTQGVVALSIECPLAAVVKLKCETDFVAASEQFVAEADELAKLVRTKGVAAVGERAKQLEDLQILLKEKIELGDVVRFEAAAGNIMDSYLHLQGGRGVNVVLVEMSGATEELAHDIAVHIAFARPKYLTREEVPAEVVAAERATLEVATRNEGKPEAAIAKIVDGKLNGFFKDLCLLEQPYAKDDKKSVKQVIGNASIVRFAQVEIG